MGMTPPGAARNSPLNVSHPYALEEKLGAGALFCAATSVAGSMEMRAAASPPLISFAEVNIVPSPAVQKSGLAARGISASLPEYHWMFSAQTISGQPSGSRTNVMVAVH